ncbi:MAG TPA: ABC transporter permease [Pyrinomonadaceae bacterium]|nr:ABC transporter permease [Pyrinomonadaceae bacterium]
MSKSVVMGSVVSEHGESSGTSKQTVIVNDADHPAGVVNLRELWRYRDLLYFLIWRDTKVRYKQAAIGAAWAIIQPLGMMLIFAVFFGVFMGVPTDGMPHTFFFYCGLMPWVFFSGAVSAGSVSLINSSNLITKVYFPRVIVPAAAVGALLVDLLITSAILLGLSLYYGLHWSWVLGMFPVMLLLTIILALDLAIWLAALTVKYRDIRHALPFVLQLWMFVTPIIYPLSVIPGKWRWIIYLNPLTGIIEGIRSSLTGRSFNLTAIAFSVGLTLLTMPLAVKAFQRIEKSFADLI